MKQYLDLLSKVLDEGEPHDDRTGVGTLSLFGEHIAFDLNDGQTFPIVTTKFVPLKKILGELFWFLSGSSDIRDLWAHDIKIWDGNYFSESWQRNEFFQEFSVGQNYGRQWRYFGEWGIDQITQLIANLQNDPYSRRHVVTAWEPGDINKTALPPCHILYQVKVHRNGSLSMIVYMRSIDLFLGFPWNISSYAALLLMLARICERRAHRLTMFLGDVHIYRTHIAQVMEQLQRVPHPLPQLNVSTKDSIFSYTEDDFILTNYLKYPTLKAEMAV